jgi:signal transduction histidine kinase
VFVIITISVVVSGAAYTITEALSFIHLDKIPGVVQIAFGSCVLGLIISGSFSKIFISPIKKLSNGAKQVASGDFSVKLEDKSRLKDMEELYGNFNTMVEEIRNTETLRTDFVTNVSHEFKTPINAIEGYAMLLQDSGLAENERQECVEKILFNTKRLSTLVGNMLLISKLESQSIPEEKTTFRLDEQIRQSILALESKWTAKNIEFDVELQNVNYTGLEPLLSHVWTNLIENAIKYTDDGGKIEMRLTDLGEEVEFTISDNGVGMSDEVVTHAFDKFYQGDTSHRAEGNGLGLALVKKIVDMSHGDVEIFSIEGGGTTFTVTLPN